MSERFPRLDKLAKDAEALNCVSNAKFVFDEVVTKLFPGDAKVAEVHHAMVPAFAKSSI